MSELGRTWYRKKTSERISPVTSPCFQLNLQMDLREKFLFFCLFVSLCASLFILLLEILLAKSNHSNYPAYFLMNKRHILIIGHLGFKERKRRVDV